MHPLIALVGPSGAGKTRLMLELVRLFPTQYALKRAITTRPKRSDEDDLFYTFISKQEFEDRIANGSLLQHVTYAGHYYGTDRAYLNNALTTHTLLAALVESGVQNFRRLGYHIKTVRIVPVGHTPRNDASRLKDDATRAQAPFHYDCEIENNFREGGLQQALQELVCFLQHP